MSHDPHRPLLLTVPEACRLLSLGRTRLQQLINAGEIPSIKCGRSRRVPLSALEAWVRAQTPEIA